MHFVVKLRKFTILQSPLSELIRGPQAFHQLNLALLRSGILRIKLYTHWNETETKQLQIKSIIKSIKLFYSAPKSWPENWPT